MSGQRCCWVQPRGSGMPSGCPRPATPSHSRRPGPTASSGHAGSWVSSGSVSCSVGDPSSASIRPSPFALRGGDRRGSTTCRAGRTIPSDQAGAGGSRPGRRRFVQPRDRRPAGHLRAHRPGTRGEHPAQARVQLPLPHRRLGHRTPTRRSGSRGTRASPLGRCTVRDKPRRTRERAHGSIELTVVLTPVGGRCRVVGQTAQFEGAHLDPVEFEHDGRRDIESAQDLLGTHRDVPPEGRSLVATHQKARTELGAPVVSLVTSHAPRGTRRLLGYGRSHRVRPHWPRVGCSSWCLPPVVDTWTARVTEEGAGNTRRPTGSVTCSRRARYGP